ncbi:collagen binding domain-containing protein, partial [Paenibacillus sp. VTT E-133291]|uniref:collagen binding domain-containing protein n=1 Tax=Paenibacillus sp. VTT E-133291 TaxID=1986223 RepID=UPI000BA01BB0
MWKKRIGLWMVVILLGTQFFNAFGFDSQVRAEAIEKSTNIITSVTMSVYENGVQVTDSVYKLSSTVKLNYNWSVPDGNNYAAGDTFTFELPEGFVLEKDFLNKKIMIDGEVLGHYDIIKGNPNKVILTFTGEVGEYFDVKGAIEVETRFDTTKFTDTVPHTIKFPINGGAEQEITVRFKPEVKSTIEKNGVAVGTNQGNFNAKQIKWTVDVNKVMDSVYGAVVTDVIPTGLALTNISDVKVSKLNVALSGGAVSPGAPLNNSQYSASLVGNTLEVKFITPDSITPITEAYRIEYVTDVIDDTKITFVNTATFKGTNTGPFSDDASVSIERGVLLKKFDLDYKSVTQDTYWAINYNYGERSISKADAKLSDYYSDSQVFVPGSMKVFKVDFTKSKDNPDKVLVNDYTVSENTLTPKAGLKNFELSFNNNISNAYRIEYQTRAIDRIEKATKVENTVTTVVNDVYKGTADRTLNQDIISKWVGQANYADKTVSWTIKINSDKKVMDNVAIKDIFPNKGLEFTKVGFVIKDDTGKIVDPSLYTLDDSKPTEGFTIKFKSPIDKTYTIAYKTYFNNDWLKNSNGTVYDWVKNEVKFLNRATIEWNDPSKPTDTKTITVESTFDPDSRVKDNGYKNGSYDAQTKEIAWEIGINYNSKELDKAVLVDTLEDKQQLIEESIKVYELSIESSGNPKVGKEVTVTSSSNPKLYSVDYNKTTKLLKISFNDKIAKPYLIKFTTSLKDQVVENEKIKNTAKLSDNGVPVSKDLKSEVNIPYGGKNDQYVTKTGVQDPKNETKLNWTLKINYNQSLVEDAQITDNPDANQMFLPESFRLLPTTISAKGEVSESGPALTQGADKDYTLEFSKDDKTGAEQFILKFNHTIEKPFILKYDSIILEAKNNGKISNSVKFSGNGSQIGTQSKDSSVTVVFSDSSGIGQGTRKELAVKKVDAADNSKVLEGAIFNLYRVSGSEEVLFSTSIPTDKDGKTVFKDLRPGKYFLQEKTAPIGYIKDSNKYEVKFSSTTVTDMTVTNQKIVTPTTAPTTAP